MCSPNTCPSALHSRRYLTGRSWVLLLLPLVLFMAPGAVVLVAVLNCVQTQYNLAEGIDRTQAGPAIAFASPGDAWFKLLLQGVSYATGLLVAEELWKPLLHKQVRCGPRRGVRASCRLVSPSAFLVSPSAFLVSPSAFLCTTLPHTPPHHTTASHTTTSHHRFSPDMAGRPPRRRRSLAGRDGQAEGTPRPPGAASTLATQFNRAEQHGGEA